MLVVSAGAGAYCLLAINFIAWGHWTICSKLSNARAQPFAVIMIFAQCFATTLLCTGFGSLEMGASDGSAQADSFFTVLGRESQYTAALVAVTAGGGALAVGDFAAAAAVELLGVAVGGPVTFTTGLIGGMLVDYFMDGCAKPGYLLVGGLCAVAALVCDSQSHQADAERERLTDCAAVASTEMVSTVPRAYTGEAEPADYGEQANGGLTDGEQGLGQPVPAAGLSAGYFGIFITCYVHRYSICSKTVFNYIRFNVIK